MTSFNGILPSEYIFAQLYTQLHTMYRHTDVVIGQLDTSKTPIALDLNLNCQQFKMLPPRGQTYFAPALQFATLK